jgi:formylglycine-generating enzyme required for sulfatase activity
VSSYANDPKLNLTSAENDAQSVYSLFEPMIEPNCRRYLDSAHAKRADIIRELQELKRRTSHGDALIVYLSMHGALGTHDVFYLLPADAERDAPEVNGIAAEDLRNLLRPVDGEASHVIVVLDACLSGSISSSDTSARSSVAAASAGKFLLSSDRGGVGVLSSSGPGEDSLEDVSAHHGLFTEYLLQGLSGTADHLPWGNQDGRLTFREVLDFVSEEVKVKSGDKQHPRFSGDDGVWIKVGGAVVATPPTFEPPNAAEGCPPGMAREPAGQFVMGEHRPPRSLTCDYVTTGSFCIDAAEVTVSDYARCNSCSSATSVAYYNLHLSEAAQRSEDERCNANHPERGDHPINCVDWAQASAYCNAQGKRLPTEEEWEWAARRGSADTPFPWGTSAPGEQLCWSGVRRRDGTCPVAETALGDAAGGVHDLAGNVAEWTLTPFSRGTRVAKGGAWRSANPAEVSAMGPASRGQVPESLRSLAYGFRCVWPANAELPRVRNDMCH